MSNITVRNNGGSPQLASVRDVLSPLQGLRDLLRWDPFAEMSPFVAADSAVFAPDFDVKETKDGFLFRADLPGVEVKDIDVQMTDNRLTISGKREQDREEKTDTTYRRERSYGSFTRSFTLPTGADSTKVGADLKNGVLTVSVPRLPQTKAKQIEVKSH